MCKVSLLHKSWADAAEMAVIADDQKMPDYFKGVVCTWAMLQQCLADAGAFRRGLELHFMTQLVDAGAKQIADIENMFKVVEPSAGDYLEVFAHRPSSRTLEQRLFSDDGDKDKPDCIDIVDKAWNNLRAHHGILARVLDKVVLEVTTGDCGSSDASFRAKLEMWNKTKESAGLFLMACTAWDLMLGLEVTTKKSRTTDFAELKKSIGTICLCVCVCLCV